MNTYNTIIIYDVDALQLTIGSQQSLKKWVQWRKKMSENLMQDRSVHSGNVSRVHPKMIDGQDIIRQDNPPIRVRIKINYF